MRCDDPSQDSQHYGASFQPTAIANAAGRLRSARCFGEAQALGGVFVVLDPHLLQTAEQLIDAFDPAAEAIPGRRRGLRGRG
jgi:hypothetical protein